MYRISRNFTTSMLVSITRDSNHLVRSDVFNQLTRCLATTSVGDVLFPTKSDFPSRHIGPRKTDVVSMLDTLGYKSLAELTERAVPKGIQLNRDLNLDKPLNYDCPNTGSNVKPIDHYVIANRNNLAVNKTCD